MDKRRNSGSVLLPPARRPWWRATALAIALLALSATARAASEPPPPPPSIWSGTTWGEGSRALAAQFGAQATILPWVMDFGDSYTQIVLRDVPVGGAPLIAYFQMDKRTGGLKRVQLELPRHGVNVGSLRAVVIALETSYGRPDAACYIGSGPANGYQPSAEWLWRQRGNIEIRAIFRDTTIEAVEGCLFRPLTSGPCGLTGQFLVRISPPGADRSPCSATPPAGPAPAPAPPAK